MCVWNELKIARISSHFTARDLGNLRIPYLCAGSTYTFSCESGELQRHSFKTAFAFLLKKDPLNHKENNCFSAKNRPLI